MFARAVKSPANLISEKSGTVASGWLQTVAYFGRCFLGGDVADVLLLLRHLIRFGVVFGILLFSLNVGPNIPGLISRGLVVGSLDKVI